MTETPWQRLYRLVEERRLALDLTLLRVQSEGGPSPKWVQKLRTTTGAPTPRMRSSMQSLDRALQWPDGTSWSLVSDDRSSWTDELLRDEERSLLDVREADVSGRRGSGRRNLSPEDAAFAAQLRAERAAAGLSQDLLAMRSGVSKSTIIRIEAGARVMSTTQLGAICRALGISLATFATRAEERMRDDEQTRRAELG